MLMRLLALSSNIEFEENNISVLHLIRLAFLAVPACSFHGSFSTFLLELVKGHNLSADKASLEIGVDHSCGLRSFVTPPNDPRLDLVGACRIVLDEVDHSECGFYDL